MLKVLMLRKQKERLEKTLAELRAKTDEFDKREAELEACIEEATTDEEMAAVNEEVEKFNEEKADVEENAADVERQISDIESEIEAEEEKNKEIERKGKEPEIEREEKETLTIRTKFFGLSEAETRGLFEKENVQSFMGEVRTCIKEKRALTNVGLTIPEDFLPMLETVATETSKLIGKVNLQSVNGTGRQVIMGTIPEAVWTEMCANLNELSLGFNGVEVDGYKVGGFFAVCDAVLEDNDVQLASKIIDALGRSTGKAVDKAIVYGTGVKMPQGIVTRLAQTSQPADYPATARTWVDLHTTNVITGANKTGLALFQEIVGHTKVLFNDYFEDGLIWIMNKKTHTDLIAQGMAVDSGATIKSSIDSTMPVVGGEIIELPFIPDNNIIVGYGEAYLLAQRAGTKLATSEHVKFLADQTVFKGTARYDGLPVIAEAFAVFTITNSAPTTSGIPFPEDAANPS